MNQQTVVNPLPAEGLCRLSQIIGYKDKDTGQWVPGFLSVSKSHWYQGIIDGIYPKPAKKFGTRCTLWDVADIRKLRDKVS